jgi:hypothetical protein
MTDFALSTYQSLRDATLVPCTRDEFAKPHHHTTEPQPMSANYPEEHFFRTRTLAMYMVVHVVFIGVHACRVLDVCPGLGVG